MNKQQLVEKVAKTGGLPRSQIENILNILVDNIKKTVKKGDDVKIVGFGTFTRAKRKARMGRNPQTGKPIKISAGWYPKFRSGAEFRRTVK